MSVCVLTHSTERQRADRVVYEAVVGQQSSTGCLVSHFIYHLQTDERRFM